MALLLVEGGRVEGENDPGLHALDVLQVLGHVETLGLVLRRRNPAAHSRHELGSEQAVIVVLDVALLAEELDVRIVVLVVQERVGHAQRRMRRREGEARERKY